jgi:hypothetical protein
MMIFFNLFVTLTVLIVHIFLYCTGFIWAVTLHWLDTVLFYTVIDQDIVFLVPDLCWVTVIIRNSNSICTEWCLFQVFPFWQLFWAFWNYRITQYMSENVSIDWLIKLVFDTNFSNISAISWHCSHRNIPLIIIWGYSQNI